MEETLFGSEEGLQTAAVVAVGCSCGCSILGITKFTPPPPTLLDVAAVLLLGSVAAAALFLPFLATDITLVALSAFFWCFL